jgi:DEAD/DEAH box helicase domain-containing protein
VHEAFYKFVTDAEDGFFKVPYVSLKLPFVKATDDELIPWLFRVKVSHLDKTDST